MKLTFSILSYVYFVTYSETFAATIRPVLEISETHYTVAHEPTVGYETSTEECPINSAERCDPRNQVKSGPSLDNESKNIFVADKPEQLEHRIIWVDELVDPSPVAWGKAEDTLRQVILLHRHGDRTPITFSPNDPLKTEPFWTFHGLGQLTNRGKHRLHLLGKLMRSRYNDFMDNSVNKNQVTTQSSGSLRCIESAETFLSGFLDLSINSSDSQKLIWSKNNDPLAHIWQPVSVKSVPVAIDGMLAEGSTCINLAKEYEHINDLEQSKRINLDYKHEAKVLNSALGFEFDYFYKWFWASSLIEVERSYFPDKMQPEILKVYDRVQEAGNKGLTLYQSSLKSKRLRGGLLIGDMIRHMESRRNLRGQRVADDAQTIKKFVHYAAHDLTNIVLLGILGSWDRFKVRPDYASNIVIELHQDKELWFVQAFYMAVVPSKPVELQLEPCYTEPKPTSGQDNRRCSLDRFKEMVKPYVIDRWQDWMKECGNDFNGINPYETTF